MLLAKSNVDALAIATLVIAVLGAITGVVSLGWSAVSYVRSGVRIKVELRVGVLSSQRLLSADPLTTTGDAMFRNEAGLPVVVLTVRNIGRLPAVVEQVTVGNGSLAVQLFNMPSSPKLPSTIEVSAASQWYFPAIDVFAMANGAAAIGKPSTTLFGRAVLGSGVTTESAPVLIDRAAALLGIGRGG